MIINNLSDKIRGQKIKVVHLYKEVLVVFA